MVPLWIENEDGLRLAIVRRPDSRRVREELAELRKAGVDLLVSMLPDDESLAIGLGGEAAACEAAGIAFRSFPIRDHETPGSSEELRGFVEQLRRELRRDKGVAVHCFASIGRSSMLLAAILCAEGMGVEEAFARISEARGVQVPDTVEQARWVEKFAALLMRG